MPACDNGEDDDGDGLTDLQDPGCFTRGGASEDDPPSDIWRPSCYEEGGDCEPVGVHAGVAGVFVTPDGHALYVLDRNTGQVTVVDLLRGELVDTREEEPFVRSLGLSVAGLPVDLAFSCFSGTDPEPCRPGSPDVYAVVTSTEGEVTTFEVKRADEPVHRPLDARSQLRTRAGPPSVHNAHGDRLPPGTETPPPAHPWLGRNEGTFETPGEQGVVPASERGPHDPSGLLFGASSVTDQVWRVTWEGVVPYSDRKSGSFPLDKPGVLEDLGADYCRLGVVPGDRLLLLSHPELGDIKEPAQRSACERVYAQTGLREPDGTTREGFEYCIWRVKPERLYLRAVPRAPREVTLARGVCPEARPGDLLDPLPAGPLLEECFRPLVRTKVRASGEFLVLRSNVRLSHNLERRGDACRTRRDAHPLRRGRVRPGERFANASLAFTPWLPADGSEVERGTYIRIELVAGVDGRRLALGNLTAGVAVDPATGLAYVTEVGFDDLWRVNPVSGGAVPLGQ